jgi:hypothetical protein
MLVRGYADPPLWKGPGGGRIKRCAGASGGALTAALGVQTGSSDKNPDIHVFGNGCGRMLAATRLASQRSTVLRAARINL